MNNLSAVVRSAGLSSSKIIGRVLNTRTTPHRWIVNLSFVEHAIAKTGAHATILLVVKDQKLDLSHSISKDVFDFRDPLNIDKGYTIGWIKKRGEFTKFIALAIKLKEGLARVYRSEKGEVIDSVMTRYIETQQSFGKFQSSAAVILEFLTFLEQNDLALQLKAKGRKVLFDMMGKNDDKMARTLTELMNSRGV